MRRPTATAVSAARMKDLEYSGSARTSSLAASALARASRCTKWRGTSPRVGVSSMVAGLSASGMMPTCSSRASLRGEAEASTSFGLCPLAFEARGETVTLLLAGAALSAGSELPPMSLFEAVRNPSLSEIIGRHLDQNLIAGKHPDPVLAHPSRRMGDDLVIVLEFHPEGGVGEQLGHYPRKFQHFFLRHKASFGVPQIGGENGRRTRQNQGGLLMQPAGCRGNRCPASPRSWAVQLTLVRI